MVTLAGFWKPGLVWVGCDMVLFLFWRVIEYTIWRNTFFGYRLDLLFPLLSHPPVTSILNSPVWWINVRQMSYFLA